MFRNKYTAGLLFMLCLIIGLWIDLRAQVEPTVSTTASAPYARTIAPVGISEVLSKMPR